MMRGGEREPYTQSPFLIFENQIKTAPISSNQSHHTNAKVATKSYNRTPPTMSQPSILIESSPWLYNHACQ